MTSTIASRDWNANETSFIIERAGGFGFANRAGIEVIPPKFTNAIAFSEGLAAVHTGGMWGHIDVDGKDVLPARFQTAGQCHEGLAAVAGMLIKSPTISPRCPYQESTRKRLEAYRGISPSVVSSVRSSTLACAISIRSKGSS